MAVSRYTIPERPATSTCNLKRLPFYGCFLKRSYMCRTIKHGLFLNDRIFVNYIMHNAYQSVDFFVILEIVYDRIRPYFWETTIYFSNHLETTVYFSNHDRICLNPYFSVFSFLMCFPEMCLACFSPTAFAFCFCFCFCFLLLLFAFPSAFAFCFCLCFCFCFC